MYIFSYIIGNECIYHVIYSTNYVNVRSPVLKKKNCDDGDSAVSTNAGGRHFHT